MGYVRQGDRTRSTATSNQTLRATTDIELVRGPDYRVTVGPAAGGSYPTPYWGNTGAQNARIILSRWPVLQVTGVQTCPNNLWPRDWTSLPAGYFEPEVPPLAVYNSVTPGGSAEGGQAVIVGGGYINWGYGRNGWAIQVSYINGWPHCSLTSAVAAGVTSLPVNDCTGWAITDYYGATGATGTIKDSGQQEAIHVTSSSVTAGPGNLTLSTATTYPHQAGTIVTTIPTSIEQACIYFATAEALTRGATSTTIHSVGGGAAVLRRGSTGADRGGRASATPTAGRSEEAHGQQASSALPPAPRRHHARRTGGILQQGTGPPRDPTTARQRSQQGAEGAETVARSAAST